MTGFLRSARVGQVVHGGKVAPTWPSQSSDSSSFEVADPVSYSPCKCPKKRVVSVPISFKIHAVEGYFISTWEGAVLDSELKPAYEQLLEAEGYKPGFYELSDMRSADMTAVSADARVSLFLMVQRHLDETECPPSKTAIIVPEDLPFGLPVCTRRTAQSRTASWHNSLPASLPQVAATSGARRTAFP